jgi:acetylglutamate kinase
VETTAEQAAERAAVLVEALPYITRFRGAVVVVKYGGNAMPVVGGGEGTPEDLALFAEDIALMRSVGIRPVVVHGGGPQIGDLMQRLGKEPEFRDGRRVTDGETLDIVRMVLVGKVRSDIVGALNVHGPLAVGVSGDDARLIEVVPRDPSLGFVGEVSGVNPAIVERLLSEELIPVISTIGSDAAGQAYNINADTAAGAIAAALGAEKLIYLTNVEGLRRVADDPSSLAPSVSADELDDLLAGGAATEGMIPKLESCLHAVRGGVRSAHILDGRVPHVLLLELFTDRGIGTMVTP